jgi:hypothetical protein
LLYNKHKDIKIWSRKQLHLYSPFKNSERSLLGTHVTWHDAYCQAKENISTIRSKFNCNMQNKHTNEENDDMNLKSNPHVHKTYGMMTLVTHVLSSLSQIN